MNSNKLSSLLLNTHGRVISIIAEFPGERAHILSMAEGSAGSFSGPLPLASRVGEAALISDP